MADTKEKLIKPEDMTDTEVAVVKKYYDRQFDLEAYRDRDWRWFNGRTWLDYMDDNQKRWASYMTDDEVEDEWQPNIFTPVTRNKLIAIAAKFAQMTPGVYFKMGGKEDKLRVQVMEDVYYGIEEQTDADMEMFFVMLETLVVGTCFVFEGYKSDNRKIREIDMEKSTIFDDPEGELVVKERIVKERGVFSEIIPFDEAFPGDIGKFNIDDMPDFHWRTEMTKKEFDMRFTEEQFPAVKNVKKAADLKDFSFFAQDLKLNRLAEDQVQVIRCFNKKDDEWVILANGRWINPMGRQQIMPMPWNNGSKMLAKRIPIWKTVFEPFTNKFVAGKAAPDKFKGEQDAINVLLNMMLSQTMLSTWRPILTSDTNEIEDDWLTPAKKTPVGDINAYKELEISPPNIASFRMLELLFDSVNQSSVDRQSGGQTGPGDITATAVQAATQAANQIAGLFTKFLLWGARDKARLRMKNILQFMMNPLDFEDIEEGTAGRWQQAFPTIKREGVRGLYSAGKKTRTIKIVGTPQEIPASSEISKEEENAGEEVIYITPSYLRKIEWDVKPNPDSLNITNKALEKAEEIEFQLTLAKVYPQRLSDKTFADLAEKYGKRPEEYPSQSPEDQGLAEIFGAMGGPKGAGTDGKDRFRGGDLASQRQEVTRQGRKASLSEML